MLRLALLLLVLSPAILFGTARFVLYQAEKTADGNPFCVQYASQNRVARYAPIRSLWELTFVAMQARYLGLGGSQGRSYSLPGVLVVDKNNTTELWDWSWRILGWRPVSDGARQALRIEAACTPERDFGARLPVV
uniref:hypothetical protein n=1 Tax=Pararhizobium sp. IMCC3301 TaxID=3067904 RepID=UPI002740DE36|nr:hypothetical protein [Pararhizobium sp. IMCC3301]